MKCRTALVGFLVMTGISLVSCRCPSVGSATGTPPPEKQSSIKPELTKQPGQIEERQVPAVQAVAGQRISDTNAPEIVSLSFTPQTVSTATTNATVVITARIKDDLTGLKHVYVYFKNPNGKQFNSMLRMPTASTPQLDCEVSGKIEFPQYSPAGEWMLSAIWLKDRAENEKWLRADPKNTQSPWDKLGFPCAFKVE